MRCALLALGLLTMTASAAGATAPLEIDVLEAYLGTGDVVPGLPHCARNHGHVLVPGQGPVAVPAGATNRMLREHIEFHIQMHDGERHFEPSPDDADRYGELFLTWHEYYLALYQRWRAEHGHPPLAGWDPGTPMPSELAYAYPERACTDGRNDDPRVPLPTWATLAGGDEPDPIFGHTRLCDFQDVNQFGKSIAAEWHGAWHAAVGGEMRSLHGPRDPAFWAAHQFIVDVTDEWRAQCAGASTQHASAASMAPGAGSPAREVPGATPAIVALAAIVAVVARRKTG